MRLRGHAQRFGSADCNQKQYSGLWRHLVTNNAFWRAFAQCDNATPLGSKEQQPRSTVSRLTDPVTAVRRDDESRVPLDTISRMCIQPGLLKDHGILEFIQCYIGHGPAQRTRSRWVAVIDDQCHYFRRTSNIFSVSPTSFAISLVAISHRYVVGGRPASRFSSSWAARSPQTYASMHIKTPGVCCSIVSRCSLRTA